jgi:AraC-like DNA-binding protein
VDDFLKGDSVSIPLFETWHPLAISHHRMEDSFIGDETKELYAYLIPVADSTGQVAIAKVENGIFSLLPTVCPIPMQSQGETIAYGSQIVVDQRAGRAYLLGISGNFHSTLDEPDRLYLVCIDYAEATDDKPAPLTLYYTDPIMDVPDNAPVLDADGNLLLAGGLLHNSNFTPSGAVWRLCVGKKPVAQSENSRWPMALLILVALLAVCACVYIIIKKRRQQPAVNTDSSELMSAEAFAQLMERINQAMESKKLYQNSDLKVNDLAAALGTNRRTVSDCINSQKGCNFTQFVNIYRVEHAKRAMLQNPDKKIADIYIESGFANEGSFFRTFKAVTGMTPKEWLSKA